MRNSRGFSRCLRFLRISLFGAILSLSVTGSGAALAAPYEGEDYGYGIANYFKLIDMRLRNKWGEASNWNQVPAELCAYGRCVVSFRINRKGVAENVKLRHCALESVLPVHRNELYDVCRRLDQSMLDAVVSCSPFPRPPREFNSPRNMVVIFDPARFAPLKIMFDDGIPPMSGPVSPIPVESP
ncbi:MAG: TonB C-terminal domain-containing protein [Candidatus Obscuribacterales bacterium]|nr:TonB C-terminal domain-containing protein [Candidatus Obscuribacterales bacterium]